MANLKYGTHVDKFLVETTPRHEPEVEDSRRREAFDEVRATRLRGRESITLDVRLADRRSSGYSYAYLMRVDFTPGDAIELHFADSSVHITGRKLHDLYQRLLDHRVGAVQEGTETEEELKPDEAAHIDQITIRNKEKHQ